MGVVGLALALLLALGQGRMGRGRRRVGIWFGIGRLFLVSLFHQRYTLFFVSQRIGPGRTLMIYGKSAGRGTEGWASVFHCDGFLGLI